MASLECGILTVGLYNYILGCAIMLSNAFLIKKDIGNIQVNYIFMFTGILRVRYDTVYNATHCNTILLIATLVFTFVGMALSPNTPVGLPRVEHIGI